MNSKTKLLSFVFNRFFTQVFITYAILIILVFMVIYSFSIETLRSFYMKDLETHLTDVAHSMQTKISDLYKQGSEIDLDSYIKQIGTKIGIRITIIKPDGSVIADSEKKPQTMQNHKNRPEVIRALLGETQEFVRFSTTTNEEMLYLAVPITQDMQTQLVIRMSVYFKKIDHLLDALKMKFAAALAIIFAVALLIAFYFSRTISRPVHEITSAARAFGSGNFDAKVFITAKNELVEIAESFNTMADAQKKLFRELNENRTELQAVLSSMKEALIVISHDGKITLCNRSFEEMTVKTAAAVTGKAYWETFRIPDFENCVNTAFNKRQNLYRELEFNDNTFLCGFHSMSDSDKLVIVFMDISDFKNLEKLKKEFIVNLTHELKTPLTAVKGFVEMLTMEENIQNKSYLDIIHRHADRMNQIVSDMLSLSELEDNKREIVFETVNLRETVNNILKIYVNKITGKNLQLEIDIPDDLPSIPGERFKLEQAFVNLIDNAVKYTEEGKISIHMSLETPADNKEPGSVKIRILNTGNPIPAKSLPRIFERFYVVDKSRSRKLGGTGLGLSIVKHVILLHQGEIDVESSPEKGTVFTISLPLTRRQ